MERYLKILWLPFAIEFLNLIVHRVLRSNSESVGWVDGVSIAVTAAVIFAVGWIIGRRMNRFGPAILAALLIWFCFAMVAVMLSAIAGPVDPIAMKGYLLAVTLSLPIVAAVSAIGVIVAKRII